MNNPLIRTVDDIGELLAALPPRIQKYLKKINKTELLVEIVMDIGRFPEARFKDSFIRMTDIEEINQKDVELVVEKIGQFNTDNRAGIERTLHRISAIRNRNDRIIGLTCRIGRAVYGTFEIIRDILESGKNILFLGPPGIGKTTHLREAARVLSDEIEKRVVIVDTSNEIAGDGDIPHPAIGTARRMQVPSPDRQDAVMIEAVENHMPQVIVVDEIGTEKEAAAARTIAERGVQLIATAHGHSLSNLINNPTLSDLVGGVQTVILGDEEAKFRGTQKTVQERKNTPTFDILIEIRDRNTYAIYPNIAESVDHFLRGQTFDPIIRHRDDDNSDAIMHPKTVADFSAVQDEYRKLNPVQTLDIQDPEIIRVFPFGLNIKQLNTIIHSVQIPVEVWPDIKDADFVITTKSKIKTNAKITAQAREYKVPINVLKNASVPEVTRFFKRYFDMVDNDEELEEEAIREARKAVVQSKEQHQIVELSPRPESLRKVQHNVAQALGLNSMSVGVEPNRRVKIYPTAINMK